MFYLKLPVDELKTKATNCNIIFISNNILYLVVTF